MKNFNACDDFFVLVVQSHIVAAAMKMLEMTSVSETPNSPLIPRAYAVWSQPEEQRRDILHTVSTKIVDSFLDLSYNSGENKQTDQLNLYTKRLLSLGCFYLEFSDAIKEGDGDRVLRCWRYMLPIFVSSRRSNYAL